MVEEYRCPYCRKLLFFGEEVSGAIEIKCLRCKQIVKMRDLAKKEQAEQAVQNG